MACGVMSPDGSSGVSGSWGRPRSLMMGVVMRLAASCTGQMSARISCVLFLLLSVVVCKDGQVAARLRVSTELAISRVDGCLAVRVHCCVHQLVTGMNWWRMQVLPAGGDPACQ